MLFLGYVLVLAFIFLGETFPTPPPMYAQTATARRKGRKQSRKAGKCKAMNCIEIWTMVYVIVIMRH
jgi:hypothetical protein